jgi:hypothetical protein
MTLKRHANRIAVASLLLRHRRPLRSLRGRVPAAPVQAHQLGQRRGSPKSLQEALRRAGQGLL